MRSMHPSTKIGSVRSISTTIGPFESKQFLDESQKIPTIIGHLPNRQDKAHGRDLNKNERG